MVAGLRLGIFNEETSCIGLGTKKGFLFFSKATFLILEVSVDVTVICQKGSVHYILLIIKIKFFKKTVANVFEEGNNFGFVSYIFYI